MLIIEMGDHYFVISSDPPFKDQIGNGTYTNFV